jgi:hypothetical protein
MTTDRGGRPKDRASGDRRALRQAGTLLGLSAGTYAVALAAVTGFQATADQARAAALEPSREAVSILAARNDLLAANLAAAADDYGVAADTYATILARLEALEAELRHLQAATNELTGASAQLPDRVTLPRVSKARVAVPPKTHATTGASGG